MRWEQSQKRGVSPDLIEERIKEGGRVLFAKVVRDQGSCPLEQDGLH